MPFENTVHRLNRELARKINDEAVRDPTSPYAGKFVGLANGKIVAVSDDLNSTVEQLQRGEPDPQRTFVFEAGINYDSAIEMWRTS